VLNFGQLLSTRYRGRLDRNADEFLDFMQSGARRMSDLIHDLLHLSRVGSQPLHRQRVPLDEALDQAIHELEERIAAEGATVTRGPLPTLDIDRKNVIRLFANLVGNALKFRSEAPAAVHVAARETAEGWTVSVEDNGMGVDPSEREGIFEIFKRGRRSIALPGTGMGLAICQRIVERHGGRIWVEPREGGGTTFRFTLPE
jgi:light-regulated signal transduction histidine kinase (bacteriophytochrome)